MYPSSQLECQTCGTVLRKLSPAEAQKVADNPHNFIIDCKDCQPPGTQTPAL